MSKQTQSDPKGLIYESYRMEGITKPECRTIFLDWALSLPVEQDTGVAIRTLMAGLGADHPDHPMTEVLREGLGSLSAPRRRGGWRSRIRN